MIVTITSLRDANFKNILNNIYHLCIGLLPVIYVIYVPIIHLSLGTVILLGFLPYSALYIIKKATRRSRINFIYFMVFYAYLMCRSDGNVARMIMCVAAFVNLYGMIKGLVCAEKLRRVVEAFSIFNVGLLAIQVACYYVLHLKINYIPQSLIAQEYRASIFSGIFAGFYRPSALFLEPSHFTQYCIFSLISALFPLEGTANLKKAMIIGLGCIMTTSGMGIVLTFCVFAWYIGIDWLKEDNKIQKILGWIPVILLVLIILSRMTFFQTALQRIFSTSVGGYNAISGRTHNWGDTVGRMHGKTLWLGYGDSKSYQWYLTGLADSIYKYGLISVILQGLCLLHLMVKKRSNYVWCGCIVFTGLFCIAHISNFVSQVFYFGIMIADAIIPVEPKTADGM